MGGGRGGLGAPSSVLGRGSSPGCLAGARAGGRGASHGVCCVGLVRVGVSAVVGYALLSPIPLVPSALSGCLFVQPPYCFQQHPYLPLQFTSFSLPGSTNLILATV